MERIDGSTVRLTPDEEIISDLLSYLVEERGMTIAGAVQYLHTGPVRVLTEDQMRHALGLEAGQS